MGQERASRANKSKPSPGRLPSGRAKWWASSPVVDPFQEVGRVLEKLEGDNKLVSWGGSSRRDKGGTDWGG